MSPPKNHTEADAKHTTVRLTPLDHEAIHEISKYRQANSNERTRKNDILIDALWELLKRETGKKKDDIKALMPSIPQPERSSNNVAQMLKPKKKSVFVYRASARLDDRVLRRGSKRASIRFTDSMENASGS